MPAERHPLWSRLPPVPEPTPEQLARVQQSVEERARAQRLRRRLRLVPGSLVGLALLWWLHSSRAPAPTLTLGTELGAGASFHREREPVAAPAPVARPPAAVETPPLQPVEAPERASVGPATPERRAPRPAAARGVQKAPASTVPPREPQVRAIPDDAEAALLGQAIARLRHEHDPQRALAALADYRAEFPNGLLRREATLVEAESLARLGRHQELVALLDPDALPVALTDLPRSTELELLRAEALANLGRCRDAIPIFSDILSPAEGDAPVEARLRERALYGRALCRVRDGQIAAARRDLELEEDQFPEDTEKVHQALRSFAAEPQGTSAQPRN